MRRRLGAKLRGLRDRAGLTGEQVIERVGWASASKLSRIENGRSRPYLSDIVDLLDLYCVSTEGAICPIHPGWSRHRRISDRRN